LYDFGGILMTSDYMEGFHTDDDGNWIPNGIGDPDDPTQFHDDYDDTYYCDADLDYYDDCF